jgi:hypothetical protein
MTTVLQKLNQIVYKFYIFLQIKTSDNESFYLFPKNIETFNQKSQKSNIILCFKKFIQYKL